MNIILFSPFCPSKAYVQLRCTSDEGSSSVMTLTMTCKVPFKALWIFINITIRSSPRPRPQRGLIFQSGHVALRHWNERLSTQVHPLHHSSPKQVNYTFLFQEKLLYILLSNDFSNNSVIYSCKQNLTTKTFVTVILVLKLYLTCICWKVHLIYLR